MFFAIALLNGVLTAQVRKRENLIMTKEKYSHTLYLLSKKLSEIFNKDELIEYIDKNIQEDLDLEVVRNNDKVSIISESNDSMVDKEFQESCMELISAKFERVNLKEMADSAFVLKESDKLYKTLFNSISHEFRIPVTTIMGASDTLLSDNYPPETQRELIREIYIASERLNQLIENLLNMSRLESGRLTIRTGWYDVHDLVKKNSISLSNELKTFKFTVKIQEDLPLVKFDFGLMEQVIHNLLLNATQHSIEGSVIVLNIHTTEDKLIIEVADSGNGLNVNELDRVFDKFYRADKTRTGNMGLGLSIVKGFVEAHNGKVSATNGENGGAVFKVEIPIGKSDYHILPNK
jgi:two-component system sensor histidine kinase KdpD